MKLMALLSIELRQRILWGIIIVSVSLTIALPFSDPFFSLDDGPTRFTVPVVSSFAVVGPLLAAIGAWFGARSSRTKVRELLRLSRGRVSHTVIEMMVVAVIPVLMIAGLVGFYYAAQVLAWGPPRWFLVPLALAGLVSWCWIGYVIGSVWATRFAPLVAVVATFLPRLVADVVDGSGASQSSVLLPMSITEVYPGQIRSGDSVLATWLFVWFVGLTLAVVALGALWRRRGAGRLIMALLLVALAGVAANRSIAAVSQPVEERTSLIPAQAACETQGVVTYCVHPINRDALVSDTQRLVQLVQPIQNIPGVPLTFADDNVPTGTERLASTPVVVPFPSSYPPQFGFGTSLRLIRGIGLNRESNIFEVTPTAAEVVIACWLTERTGAECPLIPGGTVEAEVILVTQPETAHIDIAALDEQVVAAVGGFSALPLAEQQAWLADHWQALGQGDVTLDQLPA